MMATAAFAGLVHSTQDKPVPVKRIGPNDFYVVTEDGFDWHIEADKVDAAVWKQLKEQFQQLKGGILPDVLDAMGQGDPFTVAAYEAAIDNLGNAENMFILPEHRDILALVGFRIIIDYHGDVWEIQMPAQEIDPDFDL